MIIATQRTLLIPYNDSLQPEFLMLSCSVKNRATIHGAKTVAAAKVAFQKILLDPTIYGRAVLDNISRDYIGHIALSQLDRVPQLTFSFDKLYWDNGLASEALQAFFLNTREELKLSSVRALTCPNHLPSLQPLQKLGFHLQAEKEENGVVYYEWLYS